MLFNSYAFLGFLPLALLGFFLAARLGRGAGAVWLIAASLLFYGWWKPAFLPVLLVSLGLNFALARSIVAINGPLQGWVLAAGIGANLLALFYFKYLAALLGVVGVAFASPDLPLGISFFTFTQIGFLIDCRQGLAREREFLSYALFVVFFPHLIAGPILHNREIMPQFAARQTYRASAANIAAGSAIFLIGMLKKCLLADPLAPYVRVGFGHPDTLGLIGAWGTALAYSLQLYFDFSGYSDMAIGIARMFNLRFPANFNSPYKAQSVIDYWQRWHMTLTRYITLYLYNPIALLVTRRRLARGQSVHRRAQASAGGFATMVLLPTFVTVTLAGIWHGSGITFLVFGLLHALYLSVNHAWRLWRRTPPRTGWRPRVGRVLLTYGCVLVGSVVFRAPSLAAAGHVLLGMAGAHGVSPHVAYGKQGAKALVRAAQIVVLYAIVWGAPNTQQIMRACQPTLETVRAGPFPRLAWRPSLPWAAAFGCAAALALLSLGGSGEFLYFSSETTASLSDLTQFRSPRPLGGTAPARLLAPLRPTAVFAATLKSVRSCMARPITRRTYLACLVAASLLAFALVWGWVAFVPLAFLEPEYPAWLAKERMLAACDIGTVLVVGDSRAAVDIEPGLLPVRTTNLAVGGGEPIEALSAVRRTLACPRPPTRVIVSFDAGHFMQPDLLWERSVGFGFLDHAAIDQLRTVSRQLGDASIYGMARADGLPPWLRARLYEIRFPSLYFASLLHGGVFLRWWENRAALDRAIAARGQYFFGTQDGSSAVAVEGHLGRFAPLPVLDWYFDRMLASLAGRGIAVDFVAMPTNDTTWRQVRAPLAEGFAAYLAAYSARYPNFHVVGTVLPHWPDKWFGDFYAHLNPAGAALFSRQFGHWLDRVVPRGSHAFSGAEPPASSSAPAGRAGPRSPRRHSPGPTQPG